MLDHDSTRSLQAPARFAMPDHVQLELPIVLPNVPGTEDACVDRLTASLREQEGVSEAHVIAATNDEADRLCIHYDPEAISLPRIRQRAQSLGTELTDQYGHLSWAVCGISHPRRARTIARWLRQIDGVVEAEASAAEQVREIGRAHV